MKNFYIFEMHILCRSGMPIFMQLWAFWIRENQTFLMSRKMLRSWSPTLCARPISKWFKINRNFMLQFWFLVVYLLFFSHGNVNSLVTLNLTYSCTCIINLSNVVHGLGLKGEWSVKLPFLTKNIKISCYMFIQQEQNNCYLQYRSRGLQHLHVRKMRVVCV